jgi:hypothetical protein
VQPKYRSSNKKLPIGTSVSTGLSDNPEYLIIWHLSDLVGAELKEFNCMRIVGMAVC